MEDQAGKGNPGLAEAQGVAAIQSWEPGSRRGWKKQGQPGMAGTQPSRLLGGVDEGEAAEQRREGRPSGRGIDRPEKNRE